MTTFRAQVLVYELRSYNIDTPTTSGVGIPCADMHCQLRYEFREPVNITKLFNFPATWGCAPAGLVLLQF